jgi:hypothetical protein
MQIAAPLGGLVDVGEGEGEGGCGDGGRFRDMRVDLLCEHFGVHAPVCGAGRHFELRMWWNRGDSSPISLRAVDYGF